MFLSTGFDLSTSLRMNGCEKQKTNYKKTTLPANWVKILNTWQPTLVRLSREKYGAAGNAVKFDAKKYHIKN